MKSLKRTLSLVLALVMVLGLFGGLSMTASASSFTDDKDIQYKEAVDVMTAIGAINGKGDGSYFDPKGNITRAEAAALVARTVLGYDVVMSSNVTSSFSDVDAKIYDWAVPSIEYLVGINVINGLGDGTFNPEGNINGYAVLKMLLCCLGYGAKGEYTGDSWMLKTYVDANKTKLTWDWDGSANDLADSATREEVALFCFNAIREDKVTYSEVLKEYIPAGNWLGTSTCIKEEVYPKLKNSPVAYDEAGRPATRWELDNKLIGDYADKAALTFTKKLTAAEAEKVFRGYEVKSAGVKPQVNGTDGTEITKAKANLASEMVDESGNGILIQVYVNEDNVTEITDIVVTHTDLAKIEKISTSAKTVTLRDNNGSKAYTVNSDSPFYADLTAKKVGDYVLMQQLKGKTVTEIAEPTVVKGKLTAIGQSSGKIVSVTVDGSTYSLAERGTEVKDLDLDDVNEKKDVTLYVDTYGNAIFIEDVDTAAAYIAIARIDQTLVDGKIANIVSGYTPEGNLITLNNGNDTKENDDATDSGATLVVGRLYSYAPASAVAVAKHSREYSLTACTVPAAAGNDLADGHCALNSAAIDYEDVEFVGLVGTSTSGTTPLNNPTNYASNVKFIFITQSGVIVKTGVQKIDAKTAWALCEDVNGTPMITAVFVNGEPESTSHDVLYLTKATGSVTENNVKLYTYEAYVNGEKVEGGIKTKTQPAVNSFYTYVKDEDTGIWALKVYGTTGAQTGAADSTKPTADVKDITASYILDAGDLTDLKAATAQIVDLSGTGTDTLKDIVTAFEAQKTVTVSLIYDDLTGSETKGSVKYIYVVSVATGKAAPKAGDTLVTTDNGATWVLTAAKKGSNGQATITFASLTQNISATVTSSDTSVITVSATGADKVVTLVPQKAGTSTITVTLADNTTTFTFDITVGGVLGS